MRPIPQTVEAAKELTRFQPELDVLVYLQRAADEVQAVVPDCVGLSIAWLDEGVSFTLVASDEEIAVLDAMQYLAGGPCVEGVARQQGMTVFEEDLLDEEHWRTFSQATAAKAVKTTLSVLLTREGEVMGSANLYAASDRAFEGHHEQIAQILGGSVSDIVRNADLSFSTRQVAENAPATLRAQNNVNHAVGIIAASMNLDLDAAARRLDDAARRAGISREELARALVELAR